MCVMCACTLFYKQLRLDPGESLALAGGSLQLLLSISEPPLLFPHRLLVVLVKVLQLVVRTLEHLLTTTPCDDHTLMGKPLKLFVLK